MSENYPKPPEEFDDHDEGHSGAENHEYNEESDDEQVQENSQPVADANNMISGSSYPSTAQSTHDSHEHDSITEPERNSYDYGDYDTDPQYEEDFEDEDQVKQVTIQPEEAWKSYAYESDSDSSGHSYGSGNGIKNTITKSLFAEELMGEFHDAEEEGWDALESVEEELQQDGWTVHYEADIDEEEEGEIDEEKEIEFIFEKREFDWDLDVNDVPEDETPKDFISKFVSSRVIQSSEQEFYNKYMDIPESQAIETLSKEAAQYTTADPIANYYPHSTVPEYVSTTEPKMNKCPSVESFFKIKRVVDTQFYLYPGSKMISKDCRLDATIYQLKMAIGRYVKVPPNHLDIRRNKNLVSDEKTLLDLGGKAKKKIKFTVEINRRIPGNYEITLPKDRVLEIRADTHRKVRIEKDDGGSYHLNLTINYPTELKQMLGGFIDQRTKRTYHHAFTTMEKEAKPFRKSQISTSIQAFGTSIFGIQTLLDKSQQMEKYGLYAPEQEEKVIFAKPYFPHAYNETRRRKAAIVIQRYWRRWLAIRERKRREEGLIKRVKWAENIRKGRLEQRMAIMNEETKRQENPKRLVDLELLYRAINAWRKNEEAYVTQNRWGPERLAALATLADLESDLLLQLERTKNKINVQERETRSQRVFEKMGEPRRWLSDKSDKFVTVDDGEKVHVRQLQLIYTQLLSPVEKTPNGIKIRCALLAQLNLMTKHVKSKMAQMLTELVSRELSYLRMPKCSAALLAGVRRRMATTFFFLCQDPDFNPEAKRVQKVPWDPVKLRKDMVQCKGCRRMQYRDEFTIIKGTTVTSRCHTCMNLYRTAILRVDLNLYRHMLKELRRDELSAGVVNSVTFLIDAFDLQFLVEQIWHGQSALSGIDNRYLLRLCRWKKNKPWAPWNCVLLTEEEATAHLQLENMPDAYKDSFFHKVLVKQCTAKTYFEGIAKLTVGLDSRIEENCRSLDQKKKRTEHLKDKIRKKAKFFHMLNS